MENAQDTTVIIKSLDIDNARIQWDNKKSTSDSSESYDFPSPFTTTSPSVVINRTKADSNDVLSITSADDTTYVVDRRKAIDGIETFNMFAVGSKSDGDIGYSSITVDGKKVATIQWGIGLSTKDGSERFEYTKYFDTDCLIVLVNRMEKDGRAMIPVTSANAEYFTIDRENSITGEEHFFWIAIGDCPDTHVNHGNFSIPVGNGIFLKGGLAESTTDQEQTFNFETIGVGNFLTSCHSVVTTRMTAGKEDILPVTSKSRTNFKINRHDSIEDVAQPFYWLAVGH